MSRPVADRADRQLIADALDETLVVEAAAGTGKTTELVKRIVRLVSTGRATVDQIVAVTFSEKAAGELKLRLREELERARLAAVDADGSRLERAVQRFEEAHVNTIHGFCADLLRERPVEARIDPSFAVLTEGQSARLFDEAFADWIQRELDDPCEGVRRSLRRSAARRAGQDDDDDAPLARLKRAGRELLEWRDHPAAWRRPEGFERIADIDHLLDGIGTLCDATAQPISPRDPLARAIESIRRVWSEIGPQRARGMADYDGWEALLCELAANERDLRGGRRTSGQFSRQIANADVVAARDQLIDKLVVFRNVADADLAAQVHHALQEAVQRYEDRKRRAGAVDFLDLLLCARDLVRDNDDVRRDFQARFRYLLVDEFQDTDPLQAELLVLLAADETSPASREPSDVFDRAIRPGALFIVGDPKQSIYRFRRADVGVYHDICDRLVSRGAVRVRLRTSFRSVPAIQRMVNAAFSTLMTGDRTSLQAGYVELLPARDDHAAQPAVVALPVPRPLSDRGNVTQTAIAASLPGAVGEFVRWLVADSGYTVPDEHAPTTSLGPARRPIRAGDVCLLFRRFLDFQSDVTRPYIEALESRGLTHLLVGGKAFHEREEVDALRTALTAIEWPDDALSVFAALRGPFFAVPEEELMAWHALGHGFRPYHVPADAPSELAAVAGALTTLRDLNRVRNHRPVADTIGRLIEATRAHAGFVLWRGGEQVLANVLQIAELARRYEADGGLSFRGFVDELREAADRAPTPEAPILEEGTDGVRIMTVHKAKGLEFPVVILADIGCKLSRDDAQRHLDGRRRLAAIKLAGWAPLDLRDNNDLEAARDAAEGVRLAYVAATRARDLLVVPAIGDGPQDKHWVSPLSSAVYGGEPTVAHGVPVSAGRDTHLDRPPGSGPSLHTMRPGTFAHRDPTTGEPYAVTWWDPQLLDRSGAEPRGLRHEHLIGKDAPADAVARDRATYEHWRTARDITRADAARPSLTVMTATEWARASVEGTVAAPPGVLAAAARVHIAESVDEVDRRRPSGPRFGTLVHALVAHVPLDADPESVARMAAVQARMLGATDDERASAATVVSGLLRHPLMTRARAAHAAGRSCRREVALVVEIDGVVVDGQADLLWDDGDAWMVVDFKTDLELGVSTETYVRQVAVYLEAVQRATGRSAHGALVRG